DADISALRPAPERTRTPRRQHVRGPPHPGITAAPRPDHGITSATGFSFMGVIVSVAIPAPPRTVAIALTAMLVAAGAGVAELVVDTVNLLRIPGRIPVLESR